MTEAADSLRTAEPIKTIVVGYDGTRPAERALARAAQLARVFGSNVVVADVASLEPLEAMPGAFGLVPYYVPELENELRPNEELWRQHRTRVEELFAALGVPVEFAGVIGAPAAEIVQVAEGHAADLIVVGTREPGFLERLFGGSVSAGVARQAHCDVLIVHPGEEAE